MLNQSLRVFVAVFLECSQPHQLRYPSNNLSICLHGTALINIRSSIMHKQGKASDLANGLPVATCHVSASICRQFTKDDKLEQALTCASASSWQEDNKLAESGLGRQVTGSRCS